jgi:transketolase N-terminal domain/subunit
MSYTKRALEEVLMEFYPDGNYTESQLWEAIAEADGYELDYYEDGDLTEWL